MVFNEKLVDLRQLEVRDDWNLGRWVFHRELRISSGELVGIVFLCYSISKAKVFGVSLPVSRVILTWRIVGVCFTCPLSRSCWE